MIAVKGATLASLMGRHCLIPNVPYVNCFIWSDAVPQHTFLL